MILSLAVNTAKYVGASTALFLPRPISEILSRRKREAVHKIERAYLTYKVKKETEHSVSSGEETTEASRVQVVERVVEFPQVKVVERHVDVPQIQTVERVIELPQVQIVDRVVEVPQNQTVTQEVQEVVREVPKIVTHEVERFFYCDRILSLRSCLALSETVRYLHQQ